MRISVEVRREVSAEVRIKVSTEVGIATREIRKASSVIKGFEGFKVRVGSSGKS
jgi:hypothetical protein